MAEKVSVEREGGVARVWLERPEVHNAFDDEVIARLSELLDGLTGDATVRAIVFGGRGKSFSAGADLGWMRRAASYTPEENRADAERLAGMLRRLASCPQLTVARVQGAALGGGVGLVSACDVALATANASFGLSEVKLGIIPAVISPHVIEKVGRGRARELFATGRRFGAEEAERFGLVSRVLPDEAALDQAVGEVVAEVLRNGPGAVAAAKELVRVVPGLSPEEADRYTVAAIARARTSPEGVEGITAFLEKRRPAWWAEPS